VDHPLDEVLHELDEQAERRDAGDIAVELVADLVRHEADLLPLDELSLRVVGAALHLRRVARDFGQVLDEILPHGLVEAAVAQRPQDPVHDEVRVAPDR
jgi:hypothetical protein